MSGTANTEIDNVTLLLIEVMMYLPFPPGNMKRQGAHPVDRGHNVSSVPFRGGKQIIKIDKRAALR